MTKVLNRYFYAIPLKLNKAAQSSIQSFLNAFIALPFSVQWVQPDNYHITIAYLGEVPLDTLSKINESLCQYYIQNPPALSFQISHLELFNTHRTIPLVLRVTQCETISQTHRLLNSKIMEHSPHTLDTSISGDNFKPHITLGRINKKFYQQGKEILSKSTPLASKVSLTSHDIALMHFNHETRSYDEDISFSS